MEVTIDYNKEKSEATLKISAGELEIAPYFKDAAKVLSKEKSIKGFRPGKVPVKVAMEVFGTERVLSEAANRAVPQLFVKAAVDNEVDAIDRPKVVMDDISQTGIKFTATVSVLPQVTLGDVKNIKVERKEVKVTDEDVEKELKYLAKMRGELIDVARPAIDGDTVVVDFDISLNGEPMEGGASKKHPVTLGEGHFVPDFEKKLLGIAAGDEREFDINFPSDYAREALRGKTAQAKVKAHNVQKRMMPKLDDEFAKGLGKFKSLQELKDSLKKHSKVEKEQKEEERLHGELSEKLAETATFTAIPDALVEKEIDRRMQELQQMLAAQQKTLDEYLAGQGKKLEEVRQGLRETALKSVKVGLALRKLTEQEKIDVSEEDVQERMNQYLQQYGSTEDAKKNIDPEDLKENIENMLRNQLVMARLEEMADVTKVSSK